MTVWAISLENIWLALQLMSLVSTEGEIKPLQAICCKASAREGSEGRKLRAREKQAQQKEGHWLHSTSMLCWQGSAVGKASNQIASPEPCPSVGVTIHTCKSTSTEQRLKGRGRQKIARGKRLQLRLQIRVASIIINIKTEILPHSSSQVLCFKGKKKVNHRFLYVRKKKLPKFCFITEQLFFQVLAKPLQSLSWLV